MRRILATLSIIPSLIEAIVLWLLYLPMLLWNVPKDNYYMVLLGSSVARVKRNKNGTYTISYRGKKETITEEELKERLKNNDTK